MAETVPANVIGKLREAVASLKGTAIYKEIVEPRDGVLARFQPAFAPDHVTTIREADNALRYALSMVPNVELRLYEVEFHPKKPEVILGVNRRTGE